MESKAAFPYNIMGTPHSCIDCVCVCMCVSVCVVLQASCETLSKERVCVHTVRDERRLVNRGRKKVAQQRSLQ